MNEQMHSVETCIIYIISFRDLSYFYEIDNFRFSFQKRSLVWRWKRKIPLIINNIFFIDPT